MARLLSLVSVLLCAATLASCGGGDDGTAANHARDESVSPERERRLRRENATELAFERADCVAFGARLARLSGERARLAAESSPPQSRCAFTAPGLAVNVYLDAGGSAHQRYENRVVEQAQFGAPDPRKVPHPVPGVGERSAYGHSAQWVPALHNLFAVRGSRWITVAYSERGLSDREARDDAASLARLGFALTSG